MLKRNHNALGELVKRGDLDALRAAPVIDLQAHLDTDEGDTLLTWACRHTQAAVVEWLLDQGAQADGSTRFYESQWEATSLVDAWRDYVLRAAARNGAVRLDVATRRSAALRCCATVNRKCEIRNSRE